MGREIPSWLSAARQPAHTAASLTPRSLPTEKPPGTRPEEEGLSPGFLCESGGAKGFAPSLHFGVCEGGTGLWRTGFLVASSCLE